MFRLLPERPDDEMEVEMLLDLSFAPGRTALSSYRLRDGVAPVAGLCRIARDEYDAVAGAIRYWPVRIGEAGSPALLLGPVAVHPTRQGEGLGGLLMREGLARAEQDRWPRTMLVGDEPYYRRFGFTKLEGVEMPPPTNPARVLGIGDWAGIKGKVKRWAR
jgi:predicted N-acetyltransferase YhbS